MASLELEWAGRERVFRLGFGETLDLEEATESAIGDIFHRLREGRFRRNDVFHTVRLALIGGGMAPLDAKRLVLDRFEPDGMLSLAFVASDIVLALMNGVETDDGAGEVPSGGTSERIRFSEVSQICREFNMSPQDLRAMDYADLLNLMKGFNAGSRADKVEPPSEEEFIAMLKRDEERNGTGD